MPLAAAVGLNLDDIPGLKPERVEETEARLQPGTVKAVLFQVWPALPCCFTRVLSSDPPAVVGCADGFHNC